MKRDIQEMDELVHLGWNECLMADEAEHSGDG